jgi:DNA-binding transcriptional regulator YiaG
MRDAKTQHGTDWDGARIVGLRKTLRLTQTELAERLGLKLRMTQYLEAGQYTPQTQTIILLGQLDTIARTRKGIGRNG